jgi:hypothetical protein
MKTIFTALILLLLGGSTFAQIAHSVPPGTNDSGAFNTGNTLLRHCQGSGVDKDYCLAYIVGVVDLIGALQGSADKAGVNFWKYRAVCLPNQVDAGQIKDVVVKHLVDHPENRDQPAAQLIIIALIATWGCPAA